MTSLILAFALSTLPPHPVPSIQKAQPNVGGFFWVGYSTDPSSIGASVSGPDAVTSNPLFSHSVSMSDEDTYVRNNNLDITQVKGLSKFLKLDVEENNGLALGHTGVRAFSLNSIDTTTFSDASVVKKVNCKATPVDAPYPLTCPRNDDITDPVDAYDSSIAWSGHTKDTPGVSLSLTVTVTNP